MAVSIEDKEEDKKIFNRWKNSRSKNEAKKHFQALFERMKNSVYTAANRAAYNSNVPESAHEIYAAQSFLDSLKTYDPSKGELGTHVFGAVQRKQNRLNYLYQNLGHTPEPRQIRVGTYMNALDYLTSKNGKEPSNNELAAELGWSHKEILMMKKEIRKDLSMSEGAESVALYGTEKHEETMKLVYHDLTDSEKDVYDYITGSHGKIRLVKGGGKRANYERIAIMMRISPSKVRSLHKSISKKAEKAEGL